MRVELNEQADRASSSRHFGNSHLLQELQWGFLSATNDYAPLKYGFNICKQNYWKEDMRGVKLRSMYPSERGSLKLPTGNGADTAKDRPL